MPLWYNGIEELGNRLAEMRLNLIERAYFIYALCHPTTGEFLYVGLTNMVKNRFNQHLSNMKCQKDHLLYNLFHTGIKPTIYVFETIPASIAGGREEYWINILRRWDYKIVNKGAPGTGIWMSDLDRVPKELYSLEEMAEKLDSTPQIVEKIWTYYSIGPIYIDNQTNQIFLTEAYRLKTFHNCAITEQVIPIEGNLKAF